MKIKENGEKLWCLEEFKGTNKYYENVWRD